MLLVLLWLELAELRNIIGFIEEEGEYGSLLFLFKYLQND